MVITKFGPVSIIILLNTIVALIVFIVGLFQIPGRRITFLLFAWFIFICPLIAIIFIIMGKLVSTFYKTNDVNLEDISFSKKRDKIVLPSDNEVEMNYVALEDAMAVSETNDLRSLLIDILKNDNREMLPSIVHSINNTDTEVSHYAATAILDSLSEFRANLHDLLIKMDSHPDNVKNNLYILEYIHQTLEMKIMNDVEQRSMIYTENDVAENLFLNNLWFMNAEHYLWLTDSMISIQDFRLAETWALRAWEYRPNDINSFKCRLHVFYAEKKRNEFFECIEELKNSDIAVDKEILDLFRVYG